VHPMLGQFGHEHPLEPQYRRALVLPPAQGPGVGGGWAALAAPGGTQSTTMVVIAPPSSSFSGCSTSRSEKGYSCPCRPPLFLRTASRVLVTEPESCLSPKQASTTSPLLSFAKAPRVPASRSLPK